MTTKHVEFTTLADAQEVADRMDTLLGLPLAAPGELGQAMRDWIAGGRVGDPPAKGGTVRWSIPYELDGGGWGIVVANASADAFRQQPDDPDSPPPPDVIPGLLRAPLPSGRRLDVADLLTTPPRRIPVVSP